MIRIFGVACIFAFSIFSFVLFDRTAQPPELDDAELAQAGEGNDPEEDPVTPEFLSFAPEWESDEYRVGEVERTNSRSADRDIKQRKSDIEKSNRTPLTELAEIPPGMYTTAFGVEGCSYELSAVHKDRVERSIGTDELPEGRLIVTIDEVEPDRFSADPACGAWSEWSPLQEQLTSISNGDYWKGDLSPGVWHVPKGCLWEKVLAFRGSRLTDIEESGIGPMPLEIDSRTEGVRIRGCKKPVTFSSSS